MNSDPICNAMEYGSVSSNHVSITFNNRPAILGTPSLVFLKLSINLFHIFCCCAGVIPFTGLFWLA